VSSIVTATRATGRAEAFATFKYIDGNRRASGWRPKFNFTGRMAMAGVDGRLSDGFLLGGAIDAGRLSAKLGAADRFTVEDQTGRVYAMWHGGPVSLTIDGDYG